MTRQKSRYFATAVRMDEAFLELLEKKDFEYITVREICEKAGVNRSTFYLHYETVGDLLEESAKYIIDRFVDSMPYNTVEFLEKLRTRPLDELYLVTPEYLNPYLTYIKEHRRVFRTTIGRASALRMDDAYHALNRHVFAPILERYGVPEADRDYIMDFYISGFMAVIGRWLRNDCREPVDRIAELMQTLVPVKNNRTP